jgi:hypothetical protein
MTTKTDKFGTRSYFLYTLKQFEALAGQGFKTVISETEEIFGSTWLELGLERLGDSYQSH